MGFGNFLRSTRLSLARVPALPGLGRAPSEPGLVTRDLWNGDAARGARMLRGSLPFDGHRFPFPEDGRETWERAALPPEARAYLLGFSWLRDLRTLGTDEARLRARALVGSWLDHPPTDPLIADACVTGSRLAAWLGNYDFFAASADDGFRQRLMDRILVEARTIAALLPLSNQGWRGLSALRGLLAAALALPGHRGLLLRFQRYLGPELERLVLTDGGFAERSPEAQFQGARELAEIAAMLRTAQISPPISLGTTSEKVCAALRAMRHGDGGLALFNGAFEHKSSDIEQVMHYGARQRLLAPGLPDTGFIRIALGRALLLVDAGKPPPPGFDRGTHAGTLSFEFSVQRQRLIVNCGAAFDGAWAQALRETAAHTALVPDGRSSSDFAPSGGLSRRPVNVRAEHQAQNGAHWLDLSHDGFRASLGATWQRRLYLGQDGEDLRGEEVFEGERETPLALRFHLHPQVEAHLAPDADEVLLHAGGMIWRFRQEGGVLSLEDSIYRGSGLPEPTLQIVVRAPIPTPPPEEPSSPEPAGETESAADTAAPVEQAETTAGSASKTAELLPDGKVPDQPAGDAQTDPVAADTEPAPMPSAEPVPAQPRPVAMPNAVPRRAPTKRVKQVVRWAFERVPD